MAGDWIKVEQATLHKTEVLRMAELLGISRRECVGLLLDFWAWLDNNARTEFVRNLSRLSLDSVLNCPGFSAAIECVGWVEWDDKGTCARIINYEHHNGASAKTRAYDQKRKQRDRENASVICPDVSGLEKRREEKILDSNTRAGVAQSAPPKPASQGKRLDPLWTLPAEWADWALAERVDWTSADVERVALVFRDHWHGKSGANARKADWQATWRNWVRNERRHYKTRDPTLAERRANNMDILTGRTNGRERDITGIAERVDSAVVLPLASGIRKPDRDDVEGRGPERGSSALGG